MSFGGPSKSCPRCNTVLSASATFCGTCGYQFSAPSTPGVPPASDFGGPTQYVGQGAPGNYPPSSAPAYSPPGQPGYGAYPPQGQPGYAGYQPGQPTYPGAYAPPVVAPPEKGGAGKAIILILVLVVLVGGGAAAWFLYLNPGRCAGPLFDRHSQPSNVPLPSGCAFQLHPASQTQTNSGVQITIDQWLWTVSGSDRAAVQQFYFNNLGSNGWSSLHKDTQNGDTDISACQGSQYLLIGAVLKASTDLTSKPITPITAPSGGSVLGIAILTADNAQAQIGLQAFCKNGTPPTNP